MEYKVYNPNNKPADELPVIYGFNNGGSPGWYSGQLIAQDGTPLGSHICSSEGFMYGDLGITSDYRHDDFKKHYPDGYRMDFVGSDSVKEHDGLKSAIAEYNKNKPESKGSDASVVIETATV